MIGRAVGSLVLLAYVFYLAGGALAGTGLTAAAQLARAAAQADQVSMGALLMLGNSICVIAIGVLAVPVLKPGGQLSAYTYLIARTVEGIMLAVGILLVLALVPLARENTAPVLDPLARVVQQTSGYAYQIGMLSLAIGGVVFCRALFRDRLVPRFIAAWGLVGYGIFLVGAAGEILGYPIGVALSVPGGLFEVTLGVLLVIKGFPARLATDDAHRRPAVAVG